MLRADRFGKLSITDKEKTPFLGVASLLLGIMNLTLLFHVDSDQCHIIILPGAVLIIHQRFKQSITT